MRTIKISLMQTIADRITEHLDTEEMATPEQILAARLLPLKEASARFIELEKAYQLRKFSGLTEEEMIEILIETVKQYMERQRVRDF